MLQKSRSKHRKDLEEREKFEKKNNRYPSDHQGVATAQNSLRYAQNQSKHSQMILHDELTDFERMKLDDIKVIHSLFNRKTIKGELIFFRNI